MLLMNPLPTVETVCSMLQQEETQREVLELNKIEVKTIALFSKNDDQRCSQCGNRGHSKEKCWTVIGYPPWHPRHKRFPQKKNMRSSNARNQERYISNGEIKSTTNG